MSDCNRQTLKDAGLEETRDAAALFALYDECPMEGTTATNDQEFFRCGVGSLVSTVVAQPRA